MTDFPTGRDFRAPPIIYVGRGALLRLPEALGEFGVRRATLITDRVMGDSTWTPKLRGLAADAGVDLSVYRDLSGEPTTLDVEAALAVVRSADAQAVIGFGGGSALDTAKSAAAHPLRRSANSAAPIVFLTGQACGPLARAIFTHLLIFGSVANITLASALLKEFVSSSLASWAKASWAKLPAIHLNGRCRQTLAADRKYGEVLGQRGVNLGRHA